MSQIAWHHQSSEDVLETLEVSAAGLSGQQARDRLEEYGKNSLPEPFMRPGWRIFLSQLTGPLMLVLVGAVILSSALEEWLDAGVIILAILLNVILGFVEEYKADRSLEALRKYLPKSARVRRGGVITTIEAHELVPGDVIVFSAGDKVTADARMIEGHALEVSEAALTGESVPVAKSTDSVPVGAPVADRSSCLFAGTTVVAGRAEAVVFATGVETEIGKITAVVASLEEEATPLQDQLALFAKRLSAVIFCLSIVVILVGWWRGLEFIEVIQLAVAIAVSAVPEGLAVAVTVILAIGMQRILKQHALVRRLVAAETLGSVSVICMDKTGTLTSGFMQVTDIELASGPVQIDSAGSGVGLVRLALLATSAVTVERDSETGENRMHGSRTEISIRQYLVPFEDAMPAFETVSDLPFDSARKYSARCVRRGGAQELYVVGAPDVLLARAYVSDGERVKLEAQISKMTGRGLRVLLAAEGPCPKGGIVIDETVADLKILGFIGMHDPLRPETADMIKQAREAGIVPVMITGDHPQTAMRIAQAAGLATSESSVITGAELEEMTDEELQSQVESTFVYARVSPHHKLRIIDAWQARGKPVAMIGDGVNDAPALKAADIGVSVGSGTEVAKETADMVLLDNRFATIVMAIREGRIIFDNIRKMIVYLVSDSFGELILVVGALAMGLPLPILPAQILWINLITDGFPSLALTFEPGERGVMREPPRKKREPLVSREMKMLIFIVGILTDLFLFAIYFFLLGRDVSIEEIRTFIFLALGVDSLLYVFAIRKFRSSIFRSHPFQNRWLLLGVGVGFIFLILPLVVTPLRELFAFTMLPGWAWGLLVGLGILELILIEVAKELFHLRKRRASLTTDF